MDDTTPKKPRRLDHHISIPLRIGEDVLDRLDRISAWLVERSPGMLPKQSYATRHCLLAGLAVAEAKMAAEEATKPKPKAPARKKTPRRG